MTMVNKRMEECLTCDQLFPRIPAHPAWEWAYCPACRAAIVPVWVLSFTAPVEVANALRAERV